MDDPRLLTRIANLRRGEFAHSYAFVSSRMTIVGSHSPSHPMLPGCKIDVGLVVPCRPKRRDGPSVILVDGRSGSVCILHLPLLNAELSVAICSPLLCVGVHTHKRIHRAEQNALHQVHSIGSPRAMVRNDDNRHTHCFMEVVAMAACP